MEISVQRSKVVRIENAYLQGHKGRLVVWWYGRMFKNPRGDSTPLVEVIFRRLDAGSNEPTAWFTREVALTQLGLLRIGSIWENGISNERISHFEEEFKELDFSEGSWRHTSPSDENEQGHSNLFAQSGYPLQRPWDPNFLLEFPLPDGKRLLVPCLEFFSRYYGHHAELRRVLATYRWDVAKGRLLVPLDGPIEPGTWPVKLAWKMGKDDAIFLAHIEYSSYARNAAKGIYAQTEAAFKSTEERLPVSLKVQPWFQGLAQLKAKGVWLEDGRTFLALRILGRSNPQGETVIHERERPEGIERSETEDGVDARSHIRNVRLLPPVIDLTSNEAPDHGSVPIDIEEDEIEIMGEVREVLDRKQAVERGLVRNVFSGGSIRAVSTGESYGSGKGVGYGDIHSPVALESHGVLRDMWDAMCKLQQRSPNVVQSVGWFTFNDGVCYDSEPKLISLQPFEADDDVPTRVKSWVYADRKTKTLRGVLVMLIKAGEKTIGLAEIERKPVLRKNDDDEDKVVEESFSGLVFTLRRQDDLSHLTRELLEQIRLNRGIASDVVDALVWERPALAFRHPPAKYGNYACEAAVRNALNKVGVSVPKPTRNTENP